MWQHWFLRARVKYPPVSVSVDTTLLGYCRPASFRTNGPREGVRNRSIFGVKRGDCGVGNGSWLVGCIGCSYCGGYYHASKDPCNCLDIYFAHGINTHCCWDSTPLLLTSIFYIQIHYTTQDEEPTQQERLY